MKTTNEMRPIKFRAKCSHCDEWCYGSLVDYDDGEAEIQGFDVFHEGIYEWKEFKVDYSTIGQFTGLQDKDGRDIYEGDIIDWHSCPYLVEFRSGEFFANSEACDPERYGGFSLKFIAFSGYRGIAKVIGNATDNPEMLKGGAQ